MLNTHLHSLEELFIEYSTQMGRLETPSTPLGPPQQRGRKKKASRDLRRSSKGSSYSSSGSTQVLNELTMYLYIASISIFWPTGKQVKLYFFVPFDITCDQELLITLVSKVAAEEAFRAGEQLIETKRTMLSE